MSSIEFESNLSGEHVRRMTMQLGYADVPVADQAERKSDLESADESAIFTMLKPAFDLISMLAGAATALAIHFGLGCFLIF